MGPSVYGPGTPGRAAPAGRASPNARAAPEGPPEMASLPAPPARRRLALAWVTLLLGACAGLPAEEDRLLAAVLARDALPADQAWPGFDPAGWPLAISDGTTTLLAGHPHPPADFTPLPDVEGVARRPGRHPLVTANTSVDLAGAPTATVLVGGDDPDPLELAAVAAHEAFHLFQRRFPAWVADESQLFVYPVEDGELLALRRLESHALREALAADDCRGWAATAVLARQERFAAMSDGAVGYERSLELYEGLAQYVQDRCRAGRPPRELPAEGLPSADVRARCYLSGAAWARLLDRLEPGWAATITPDDAPFLDERVADRLGALRARPMHVDPGLRARLLGEAQQEVAALSEARIRRLAAYRQAPGASLELVVEDGASLSPQGFDPLNVERLDERAVLHTRFLQLARHDLELEVLDRAVLTQGTNAHPLFAGVRRLLITGLEQPVAVREEGRRVQLSAPGVTATVEGGTLRWVDDRLVVVLR